MKLRLLGLAAVAAVLLGAVLLSVGREDARLPHVDRERSAAVQMDGEAAAVPGEGTLGFAPVEVAQRRTSGQVQPIALDVDAAAGDTARLSGTVRFVGGFPTGDLARVSCWSGSYEDARLRPSQPLFDVELVEQEDGLASFELQVPPGLFVVTVQSKSALLTSSVLYGRASAGADLEGLELTVREAGQILRGRFVGDELPDPGLIFVLSLIHI